ncbi:aminotransferase class V-fold PLP-dependent enzyme [Mycolicibacterium neoaurum]|uniref:aminotransferase class V-fold PLP-dependent enzyme n=1 Tax=Mycolicibacterium neoaurum TaxID=1795 RepID=UPI002671E7AD|nr:aminotransferase class V-fold PLP-dependent enzyme [Mycolicibacterium neoaurum]MDO3399917.1 aminotransferase class V-fold PLP-dependent enzyme [Mycolicibacterium neoaurum]
MTVLAADVTSTLAELADWHGERRAHFPALTADPQLAYLDSSATAQKPQAVIDAVTEHVSRDHANAGRGNYPWSTAATKLLEVACDRVATFIGDTQRRGSVALTAGASAGLRAVALDWLLHDARSGDEIIVPAADHQANLLPWLEAQALSRARGVDLIVHEMPMEKTGSGDYDIDALRALVSPRTRMVAATHVHHVGGNDMNLHRIRAVIGDEVVFCVDAAQSVGHLPVDVDRLGADFLVFAGHKAMALPGIGAVWSRDERTGPFTLGGWAGSPNTTGAASLIAALDWLSATDCSLIHRWTVALGARLTEGLRHLDGIEVIGCQDSLAADSPVQKRQGIVSFTHRDIPARDLGFVLADRGILVRADGHCQARGLDPAPASGTAESVRVSTHVYSAVDEIDRLLDVLAEVQGR